MYTEQEKVLIYYDSDTKLYEVYIFDNEWNYIPELRESFANIDEARCYIKSYC